MVYQNLHPLKKLLDSSIVFVKQLAPKGKVFEKVQLPVNRHAWEEGPPTNMYGPREKGGSSKVISIFYNNESIQNYLRSFQLGDLYFASYERITFMDVYKEIENKLIREMDPLIQHFISYGSVIFLTGYTEKTGGHAICIYCRQLDGDRIEVVLTNSGLGLNQYHRKRSEDEYQGIIRNIITMSQFKQLLCAYRVFEYHIHSDIDFFYSVMFQFFQHDQTYLEKVSSNYQGSDFLPRIEYIPPQIAGTCTYYSIYYSLMYYCSYLNLPVSTFNLFDRHIKNQSLKIIMNGQIAWVRSASIKSRITERLIDYYPNNDEICYTNNNKKNNVNNKRKNSANNDKKKKKSK